MFGPSRSRTGTCAAMLGLACIAIVLIVEQTPMTEEMKMETPFTSESPMEEFSHEDDKEVRAAVKRADQAHDPMSRQAFDQSEKAVVKASDEVDKLMDKEKKSEDEEKAEEKKDEADTNEAIRMIYDSNYRKIVMKRRAKEKRSKAKAAQKAREAEMSRRKIIRRHFKKDCKRLMKIMDNAQPKDKASWAATAANCAKHLPRFVRKMSKGKKKEDLDAVVEEESEAQAEAQAETELVQYTQFPSWVETEADMEAYLKQQKIKVVRKDSGNDDTNPSGRVFKVDHPKKKTEDDEPELLQVLEKEPATVVVHDHLKTLNKRLEADDVADAKQMMEMSLLQLELTTTKMSQKEADELADAEEMLGVQGPGGPWGK